MKVAVVEFNYYHDEILPTIVYALNELGTVPDVYVPSRAAKKDAFALAPGLRYRLRLIDGIARIRGTPARHERYDVLVMNSVEPRSALESAARIDLPTVAIVHNANLLHEDGEFRRFFASPARRPMFLGRHVALSLGAEHQQSWMAPYYLGEVTGLEAARDGKSRLCVQGNVQFSRRDYLSMVDAVSELAAERSDFLVRIVGRSNGPDGRDLRALVQDRGLADRFAFNDGEISHGEYLSLVGTSDFVLPLLDSRMATLAPYFSVKITSSMSMAIGLGLVPIAEASLAKLYGVESAAATYQPGGLVGAIRAAIEMSPAGRAERVRLLAEVRSDALASSVRNLAAALDRLEVGRG